MKTLTQQFSAAFKGETIKANQTAIYWLTFAGPIFIISIFLIAFYFKGHQLLPQNQEPWLIFIPRIWSNATMVFLPIYLILLTSQLLNIEHKSGCWQICYTLPYSKHILFWSKYTLLILLTLSAIIITMLLTIGSGIILSAIKPDLGFTISNIPWKIATALSLKVFVSCLGVLSLYYFICFEMRNHIKSIGIGISLFIVTIIAFSWKFVFLIPTFYPMVSGDNFRLSVLFDNPLFSVKEFTTISCYFLFFTAAAWYRTCTKKVSASQ